MRRSLSLRQSATELKLPYTYNIDLSVPAEKRLARQKLGGASALFLEEMADKLEGEAIATFIAAERVGRASEIGKAAPQATQAGTSVQVEAVSASAGNRENVGPNHGVPQETEM